MTVPQWREISIALPPGFSEALVESLLAMFDEAGLGGAVVYDSPPRVAAYAPEGDSAERIVGAVRRQVRPQGLSVTERTIQEVDWSEAWKQFFVPRRVGKRLVVCPSWETFQARPEDILLVLDPGQAFGTGEHPTTQMCLELIERYLVPGSRMLDVGTGSGILAVAAIRLGASLVVCTDTDPTSILVARGNLERNGCIGSALLVVAEGVGWCRGRFDLCVSNLVSAALVRLASEFAGVVGPDGTWILSGVAKQNEQAVSEALTASGFEIIERLEQGEWLAMAAKR